MTAEQSQSNASAAWHVDLPANVLRLIEDAIQAHLDAAEALILMLDELDSDCEDEGAEHDGREPDTDLEPSLGWVRDPLADGRYPARVGDTQLAAYEVTEAAAWGVDLELDRSDFEPSLGSINPTFPSLDACPADWAISLGVTQENWSGGANDNRESEHDGREPG